MKTLKEIERDAILMRLAFFDGHRVKAANSLDISVRTLRYKIIAYREEGCVVVPPTHDTYRGQPGSKKK